MLRRGDRIFRQDLGKLLLIYLAAIREQKQSRALHL